MARPSKIKPFAVYIPAPRNSASSQPSFDDTAKSHEQDDDDVFGADDFDGDDDEESVLGDIDENEETTDSPPNDTECEDDRRESAFTSTSVSTFPETDQEHSIPMHQPYTPPSLRPAFRRPDSVRRMQMNSPISFDRSPRRSVLHSQSRSGTPRSTRPSAKSSPRSRRSQYEEHVEEEKTEYPLVLLHVTLLPVELRWSMQAMEAVLPQKTLENLRMLRAKVTETILQRGILIPHPREEYELLEERLLEALDLRKERVTKCGHFRARVSTSSASSEESSGEDSIHSHDSGVGSSVQSDEELCKTCQNRLKGARTVHGADGSKWHIRVFAANGLMRAPAWAAAWAEMERVDVEILPWIKEDLRRQLDVTAQEEDIDVPVDEEHKDTLAEAVVSSPSISVEESYPSTSNEQWKSADVGDPNAKYPQIYRAKDIPLSVLLKNYVFLLAKDRRSVAMFGLALIAIWLGLRTALMPSTVGTSSMKPICETPTTSAPFFDVANQSTVSNDLDLAASRDAAQAATVVDEGDLQDEKLQEIVLNVPMQADTKRESEDKFEAVNTLHSFADVTLTDADLDDFGLTMDCANPASVARMFSRPISLARRG